MSSWFGGRYDLYCSEKKGRKKESWNHEIEHETVEQNILPKLEDLIPESKYR